MAVGPYNNDPSLIQPGQITATPARVLRRVGIRKLNVRGASGVRKSKGRMSR